MSKIIFATVSIIVLLFAGWYVINWDTNNTDIVEDPNSTVSSPQMPGQPDAFPSGGVETTLSGTFDCLPHKDTSGGQTMECAFGILADDGFYYALRIDDFEMLNSFQAGQRGTVQGLFVPVEQIDGGSIYDIHGVVNVTQVIE